MNLRGCVIEKKKMENKVKKQKISFKKENLGFSFRRNLLYTIFNTIHILCRYIIILFTGTL